MSADWITTRRKMMLSTIALASLISSNCKAQARLNHFRSPADLIVSTEPPRGEGEIWAAGNFRYQEAASDANDYHIVTAGGVKLNVQLDEHRRFFSEQFGAIGDGNADDTLALQKALDAATKVNGSVNGLAGKIYKISKLIVRHGLKSFESLGATLKSSGKTNAHLYSATKPEFLKQAVILIEGLATGGVQAKDIRLSIDIDMNAGDILALAVDGADGIEIIKTHIYGIAPHPTHDQRGIRIDNSSKNVKVLYNTIQGPDNPTRRCHLIECLGEATTPFGGFFTGVFSPSDHPTLKNQFKGNRLIGGSYGINLYSAQYCSIENNFFKNQNHRSMYIANACSHNVISNNTCVQYLSSGVLLGYGASYNKVENNTLINHDNYGAGAEAAINLNTGATYNTISGNYINSPQNYCIYVGPDCVGSVVESNYMKGAYLALIRVENNWRENNHSGDPYARPNYAPPKDFNLPYAKSWAHNDLTGIIIRNNRFGAGHPKRQVAAFSVGQIEDDIPGNKVTSVRGVSVEDNKFMTMQNIRYCIHIAAATSSRLSGIIFNNNIFPSTATIKNFNNGGAAVFQKAVGENSQNGLLDRKINR